MFGHVINIIEATLIITFLSVNTKSSSRFRLVLSLLFIGIVTAYIEIINLFSPAELVFSTVGVAIVVIYQLLLQEKNLPRCLFLGEISFIVFSIINVICMITLSMILYQKADYVSLATQYGMPFTIFLEFAHTIAFFLITKALHKTKIKLTDKQYLAATLLLFLCHFLSMSYESVFIQNAYADYYLMFGIHDVVITFSLLIYLMYRIQKQSLHEQKLNLSNQILQNQMVSTKQLMDAQADLHKIRHDLKHLFRVMSVDNQQVSQERLQQFLDRYNVSLKDSNHLITPSAAFNFVYNLKRDEAIARGIDITSVLTIGDDLCMKEDDLYLLVSNAMDNAIKHIGKANRIFVSLEQRGTTIFFQVRNSIDVETFTPDSSTLIPDHGHGVNTMELILDQYDGAYTANVRYNEFCVSMMWTNLPKDQIVLVDEDPF